MASWSHDQSVALFSAATATATIFATFSKISFSALREAFLKAELELQEQLRKVRVVPARA